MRELTILEKAAAEAIWRGLSERNYLPVTLFCDLRDVDETRRTIAAFVAGLSGDILSMLTLPEITQHGRLAGGYAERWALAALRTPQHAAKVDANKQTDKQCPAMLPGLEDECMTDCNSATDGSDETELARPD